MWAIKNEVEECCFAVSITYLEVELPGWSCSESQPHPLLAYSVSALIYLLMWIFIAQTRLWDIYTGCLESPIHFLSIVRAIDYIDLSLQFGCQVTRNRMYFTIEGVILESWEVSEISNCFRVTPYSARNRDRRDWSYTYLTELH